MELYKAGCKAELFKDFAKILEARESQREGKRLPREARKYASNSKISRGCQEAAKRLKRLPRGCEGCVMIRRLFPH